MIEAVWHPHHLEVLGLYIEGVVFKWRPYEGETDELATGASRLAISRDGNLFATDDVRGTVKLFTTSGFGLSYQLASADAIISLAFSPDLRRFYDVRGNYGNVWGPTALMRFAEQRGKYTKSGNDTDSDAQTSMASERWIRRVDSITVLAASPLGRFYCYGTETGSVRLQDTRRGKLTDVQTSKSFLSIEQMCWNADGRFLCFSDSSKQVTVMFIDSSAGDSDPLVVNKATIATKTDASGPLLQLLFHPDSSQLLVRSLSKMTIISLTSFEVIQSVELYTAAYKCIPHPQDHALIIMIGPGTAKTLDWSFVERQTYEFECPRHQSINEGPETPRNQISIDRVLVTDDQAHLLVQTSTQNSRDKTLFSIESSSFLPSAAIPITPSVLPRPLSSQIALPLSFLSMNKLIFLSKTFDICSRRLALGSGPASSKLLPPNHLGSTASGSGIAPSPDHRRSSSTNVAAGDNTKLLFSLPGDWISRDCLALCCIWGIERSMLCPRNGEVAVVRCSSPS